jgi:predicted MPP superfamily phosphohydrolase
MRDPQHFSQPEEGAVTPADRATEPPDRKRAPRRAKPRKNGARIEDNDADSDAPISVSPDEHRARAGFLYRVLSRFALQTAPLASWFYDRQMSLGKGVRAVSHRVQLPRYPTGAPPLKVAYLSDLHYGPTSGRVAARQAWKLVRAAQPDVVLLGGDYLFADERGLPTLLRELQRWQFSPPPGGIYACLGNHDYYAGIETIITTLEACGVRVLVNDAAPLPSPWKGVWIAGVDDVMQGAPDIEAALERISPDACTILLSHEPEICALPQVRKAAITLAGHTHGGQICLPGGEPIYTPRGHDREYSSGLHRHAGQWLFVSRGVGAVGLALRMFAPPDVGIFEFSGRATRSAR